MAPGQRGAVEEIAAEFVREARATVERYGATEEAIAGLSSELKQKMYDEQLELQLRSERRIPPFLESWRVDELRRRKWVMVHRFTHSRDTVLSPRTRFGMPFTQ